MNRLCGIVTLVLARNFRGELHGFWTSGARVRHTSKFLSFFLPALTNYGLSQEAPSFEKLVKILPKRESHLPPFLSKFWSEISSPSSSPSTFETNYATCGHWPQESAIIVNSLQLFVPPRKLYRDSWNVILRRKFSWKLAQSGESPVAILTKVTIATLVRYSLQWYEGITSDKIMASSGILQNFMSIGLAVFKW